MSWVHIGRILDYYGETRDAKRARKLAFADYLRANQTAGERMMARVLYHLDIKAEPQVQLRGWVVDFLDQENRVVFEVDGESHASRGAEDAERDAILEQAGYRVIRATNEEVRNLMVSVASWRDAA